MIEILCCPVANTGEVALLINFPLLKVIILQLHYFAYLERNFLFLLRHQNMREVKCGAFFIQKNKNINL
jgi:hypothetical protein